MIRLFLLCSLAFALASCAKSPVVQLTEESWTQVTSGEWLVKFYAPWCPACRSIEKDWAGLGAWAHNLADGPLDGVAEVDVTQAPGLSGRFIITSLPTIFHVKEGVFRVYSGGRNKADLIDYVEKEKWQKDEVLPGWKDPTALHMSVVSWFFKISMHLRNVHSYLTEQKELPSWSVYVIFALATIVTGALLGVILVLCIDCVLPLILRSGSSTSDGQSAKAKDSDGEEETDTEEIPEREEAEPEEEEQPTPKVRARKSTKARKDD